MVLVQLVRAMAVIRIKIFIGHHFSLFAQYAADILPLAMFDACLALNDARLALSDSDSPSLLGEPETPC